ncbi:MAG: hypothetical protein APR53_03145 [Methanoculleus sp. SDB]|nr:MAG: hypothetical protein APR53_03145 [Methanoculleus sp. SDB]
MASSCADSPRAGFIPVYRCNGQSFAKKYMERRINLTCVREEELDWTLYHIIASRETITVPELCTIAGFARDDVEGSMERLNRNCLIGRSGEYIRILSIQESLVMCRVNHAQESPVVVEDGVIKYRPPREEKQ